MVVENWDFRPQVAAESNIRISRENLQEPHNDPFCGEGQ